MRRCRHREEEDLRREWTGVKVMARTQPCGLKGCALGGGGDGGGAGGELGGCGGGAEGGA